MSFDLSRTLRRLRSARSAISLTRRNRDALPFIDAQIRPGPDLLLDTTVYIDTIFDRSPSAVDELTAIRVCNHSSICLAELTHGFGRLNPAHHSTARTLREITGIIEDMDPRRLRAPSVSAWGTAGVLAGFAFRLGNYQKGQERALLNDALIYVQAIEQGQTVLTGNISDFDLLNQLLPEGRMLLYARD